MKRSRLDHWFAFVACSRSLGFHIRTLFLSTILSNSLFSHHLLQAPTTQYLTVNHDLILKPIRPQPADIEPIRVFDRKTSASSSSSSCWCRLHGSFVGLETRILSDEFSSRQPHPLHSSGNRRERRKFKPLDCYCFASFHLSSGDVASTNTGTWSKVWRPQLS